MGSWEPGTSSTRNRDSQHMLNQPRGSFPELPSEEDKRATTNVQNGLVVFFLFSFILFYSLLFSFILFYSLLFSFILFYSLLFSFILLSSL